jgi:hypothetical protein
MPKLDDQSEDNILAKLGRRSCGPVVTRGTLPQNSSLPHYVMQPASFKGLVGKLGKDKDFKWSVKLIDFGVGGLFHLLLAVYVFNGRFVYQHSVLCQRSSTRSCNTAGLSRSRSTLLLTFIGANRRRLGSPCRYLVSWLLGTSCQLSFQLICVAQTSFFPFNAYAHISFGVDLQARYIRHALPTILLIRRGTHHRLAICLGTFA